MVLREIHGNIMIYAKLIIVFTPNLAFSPYLKSFLEVHHLKWWEVNKVKEKWSTIQCDIFDLSFISFIPMSHTKCLEVARVIFCMHQTSGKCAGMGSHTSNGEDRYQNMIKTTIYKDKSQSTFCYTSSQP